MKTPAKNAPKAVNQTKAAKPGKGQSVSATEPKEPDALDKAEAALKDDTKAADSEKDAPEPSNLGDWDNNGKAGGNTKADKAKEPRPMPKDFKVQTVREGNTIVARQDGIEVPFRFTDDKEEYAAREQGQREAMWAALEDRRVKAL